MDNQLVLNENYLLIPLIYTHIGHDTLHIVIRHNSEQGLHRWARRGLWSPEPLGP